MDVTPGAQTSEWKSKVATQLLTVLAGTGEFGALEIDPLYALIIAAALEALYIMSRTLLKYQAMQLGKTE